MDVTLFELHFPNAEFNAPLSGRAPSADADPTTAVDEAEAATGTSDGGSRLAPLAALAALAGLALLARYLLGVEPDQTTLDELEA